MNKCKDDGLGISILYNTDTGQFLNDLQPNGKMDTSRNIEFIVLDEHLEIAWFATFLFFQTERFLDFFIFSNNVGMVRIAVATQRAQDLERFLVPTLFEQPSG